MTSVSSVEGLYFPGPTTDGADKTGNLTWWTSKPTLNAEGTPTLDTGECVRKRTFKHSFSAPLKLQDWSYYLFY